MKLVSVTSVTAVVLAFAGLTASAQPVISAKSGVVSYLEGKVYLGDQLLDFSATHFSDIKEGGVVRSEEGRAEVLLTPGVILRLGENSSLKLITNRLIDTRVELLTGSAVVEADEIAKDTSVTIVCKRGVAALAKAGIYRFDADSGSLKVFKGLADVQMGADTTPVSNGKMLNLGSDVASVQKFDLEATDSLDRWSHRRGEYLAMANVSAAKSLLSSGNTPGNWGVSGCIPAWGYNSWYGMMTFIPCQGSLMSPYGYRFWSPYTVGRAYYVAPPMTYSNGGYNAASNGGNPGYSTAAATSSGYSGTVSAAPSMMSSSPASSASSTAASAAASSSVGHGSSGGGGGHGH